MIKEFIYNVSKEIKSNSQSRVISGIRSFFDYLLFEGLIESNPVINIESPKLSRKLPSTLSENEINILIKNIDKNKNESERNIAIIETFRRFILIINKLFNVIKIYIYILKRDSMTNTKKDFQLQESFLINVFPMIKRLEL